MFGWHQNDLERRLFTDELERRGALLLSLEHSMSALEARMGKAETLMESFTEHLKTCTRLGEQAAIDRKRIKAEQRLYAFMILCAVIGPLIPAIIAWLRAIH